MSGNTLPGDRLVLAAADEGGITVQDVISGAELASWRGTTIWDVATAILPGGRAVIAGTGHDGLVYRWDAATCQVIGEPLHGHRTSVKAVTAARKADGTAMFITGCEAGDVLRWDAASGGRMGPPLPGNPDGIGELEIASVPDGRQILAALDENALFRWDPVTSELLGPAISVGKWARFVAVHVDRAGTPTSFVWIPGEDEDERVERWRLDTGARAGARLPGTLRAVFDDQDTPWIVLGQADGSLVIESLHPEHR